jgi:cytochrome bd ubiquinol oxidase subunit II
MTMSFGLLFVCAALIASLTIYLITGGADYGGGVWDLLASGPRAEAQRELMAHTIGPVWEADHVWLILVVVIMFDGFPPAFARIMTALHIPLTLMLVGVVLRGSAFAFRSYGRERERSRHGWDRVFAVASVIAPFWLGVAAGAIASGGIPQSPHQLSDFVLPWLTPFCFSVGLLTVSLFAYLAAVYATYETDDLGLREDFRTRAIVAAIVAGVMAGVTLLLATDGAPQIWQGLTGRPWVSALVWLTAIMAVAALYMLWTWRFAGARICAATQVALILWGWAIAQFPNLVEPDLSVFNASAPPITINILAVALAVGSLALFPSFHYLRKVFRTHPERVRFRLRRYPSRQANQQPGPPQ